MKKAAVCGDYNIIGIMFFFIMKVEKEKCKNRRGKSSPFRSLFKTL